ncbi:MAG: EamA family transporter [Sneathiella sp.]
MDPIVFSATRYIAAPLLLFGLLWMRKAAIAISWREARMLVLIGILGIARLGVTKGLVYSFFIPVIAILSSVILLDEVITLVQILGAVIVLLGVKLTRSG